ATMATLLTQHSLAVDEVCYVGQALAIVVAYSRYLAEDALAAIEVDYEVLAAISDVRSAVAEGAPRAHTGLESNIVSEFVMKYGDADAAFASAPHVFREELWQHRGGGMAMETRGGLAQPDMMNDTITLWSSPQTPHIARRMLAEILDVDLESIRIIAPDVGGGFGPKAIFYPEDAVVAHAARALAPPVN